MESMMAPLLALDGDRLELAIGSAGGTRIRTALVGVAAGFLDEGLDPVEAVERPRFHRAGDVVQRRAGRGRARARESWRRRGFSVRRWPGSAPLLRRRQPDRLPQEPPPILAGAGTR